MPRRSRRRRDPTERRRAGCEAIPVASFADIAFLLIIFFILAATLARMRGFQTDFPSGEKSEEPQKKTATVLLRGGKITLNDEDVDIPTLRTELTALRLHNKTGDDKVVILEAAGRVPYQDYYQVMAAITRAGGSICIIREEGGGK